MAEGATNASTSPRREAASYLSQADRLSRRPVVSRNVPADVPSIERVIGSILGVRYVPNPGITEYTYVLRFPPSQVITSQHLARVLSKLPTPRGGSVLVAGDFTIEAQAVAVEESCEIVSRTDFWTDAAYLHSRAR
jgi:hypothetical protein